MTETTLSASELRKLAFAERRAHLRKAFPTVLLGEFRDTDMTDTYALSPLIGDGPNQVNPACTASALRDALPPETLLSVASHKDQRQQLRMMLSAIADPVEYGVRSESSKTGWLLGYHNQWPDPERLAGSEHVRIEVDVEPTPISEPKPAKASGYTPVAGEQSKLIDMVLSSVSLPPINTMIAELNEAAERIARAEAAAKTSISASLPTPEIASDGTIPKGKVVLRKAFEVFGITRGKDGFDFDIPAFDWDAPHPHVPAKDDDYIFRPAELFRVLYAILTNQRAYLHGDTGTGKTTLIEQVAAYTSWPFMRINFDSEVTRADLMGRDTLQNEGGVTTSKFVDGILPQMMSGPYIGCFDEIDFVRPDVAYVMQRALEGNGLMLTEDGGRVVKPHRLFRMFATGNTVGQGDEKGLYQGARPQSMALLDRFTVWVKVDYLKSADRKRLIKTYSPGLPEPRVDQLNQYVGEHIEAFTSAKVLQPMSPRAMTALGNAIVHFAQFMPDEMTAVKQALACTILDRATEQDRAVLSGIADRVFV